MKGYGKTTDPLSPFLSKGALFFKIRRSIYWGNAFCESAVILATSYPSTISDAVLTYLVHRPLSTTDIRITPTWVAGCALMMCGASLRLACYRTLGKLFTWELSVKKEHILVTSGPYAIVRHPSYVASAMASIGVILCHFSEGSWFAECVGWDTTASRIFTVGWVAANLAMPVLCVARVNTEDQVLRNEFGEQWEAYAQRTPYRLLPYLY